MRVTYACHPHLGPEPSRRPKITLFRLLLIPILPALVLGLPYWYFKTFFHMCTRDDPTINLTVVKIPPAEAHALEPFRKRTISDVIDPCQVEVGKLKALLEQTKYGPFVPSDWDQRTSETLERLSDIMEQAKLRRIPERYDKEYLKVLWGIHHSERATLEFKLYCSGPREAYRIRRETYQACLKHRKKALSALKKGRECFASPEAVRR